MEIENRKTGQQANSNRGKDIAGYLVTMAVAIVLLYIVNNFFVDAIPPLEPYVVNTYPRLIVNIVNAIANFHTLYFSGDFINCLWAINLSLSISIVGNLVLLLYHPRWFLHLLKGLLLGIGILPVYIVIKTFPFNFATQGMITITRVLLIILISGLAAGFLVEMVRFVLALLKKLRENKEKVWQNQEVISEPLSKE